MREMRDQDTRVAAAMAEGRRQSSGWIRCACPLCEERTGKRDRRASLGVHETSLIYRCFKCGVRGRLSGGESVELPRKPDGPVEVGPPDAFALVAEASSLALAPARQYLLGRGIGPDLWAAAGIGACASGQYAGRVVVPVLGLRGEWLGWVARTWWPDSVRPYLYPPGMSRGEVLYHHAALGAEGDGPVLVVEGVFDALALWPDAVAVLGKPSGWQVEVLAGARRPVVVVLDGDAWEEGQALAWRLRLDGQTAGAVRLPPRTDPDEVPRDWLFSEAVRSLS